MQPSSQKRVTPSFSSQQPLMPDAVPPQQRVSYPFAYQPPQTTLSPSPTPTSGPLSPQRTTVPLTGPLTTSPLVTQKLTSNNPTTTTRLPTIIPAHRPRPRITNALATKPARHFRSATFLGIALSIIIVTSIVILFIAPLDNGQHDKGLIDTLSNFTSQSSEQNAFAPAQQLSSPTATPATLTNDGYCGGVDIWGTCATAVTASGVMGTGQMQRPLQGAIITQPFAHPEYQQWCGCWRPHTGIDLAAPYGTPIMAADSGQVIWTGWDWSGLGWAVKINHGHYIATIYGHLARFIVQKGDNVAQGQIIGYEGSTGASTGPHLHFMVLVNNVWVDPTLYIALP